MELTKITLEIPMSGIDRAHLGVQTEAAALIEPKGRHVVFGPSLVVPFWGCICGQVWSDGTHPTMAEIQKAREERESSSGLPTLRDMGDDWQLWWDK